VLIGEPQRTQADLHFGVFGIPVRVHPFFWVITALLGMNGTGGRPEPMFFWVLAVFISILVHELGHALTFRHFGWQPRITLYGMGGLASVNASRIEPQKDILITLAGPGAGFILAGAIATAMRLSGHPVQFYFGWPYIVAFAFEDLNNPRLSLFVHYLLDVNIWWGLVNLLPVYPLDGGRLSRAVLEIYHPQDALRKSLWLSVYTGAAVALYGLSQQDLYMALFFAYLAYSSFTAVESYFGRGRSGGPR
jgi:stage IV sporulation protein FB